MTKARPHVAVVGGGIGGLFAANALMSQGVSVSVYEQAPALGEIGAGVYITPNACAIWSASASATPSRNGARGSAPNSHYFRHDGTPIAPVQVTDLPAGTPPTACTAPTWSISSPPTSLPASSTPATAPPASSRAATRRASSSPTAPRSRPMLWSRPTASTRNCALMCFRRQSPCSTAPSPIAVSSRASACRTGRWTAGRCGRARRSTFWFSRCATARWSTMSALSRPTRR